MAPGVGKELLLFWTALEFHGTHLIFRVVQMHHRVRELSKMTQQFELF
tara:strand:- start:345 stop:488 length:144 start_codon:yes stop_codon:yes gene_type:complete